MATENHFDVLIVGAGISGIDAAYHVKQHFPDKTFAMLETQAGFGGTWRTHKYPGIRSDSDLFTFGYKWKPWMGAPIATADEILKYLREVLEEQELESHINFGPGPAVDNGANFFVDPARLHASNVERGILNRLLIIATYLVGFCDLQSVFDLRLIIGYCL